MSASAKTMSVRKKLVFFTVASCLVVVGLEAALQVLCLVSPKVRGMLAAVAETSHPPLPDPLLLHRPDPEHPEHDARGFRNASVPATVEVVAMGDSQTYGAGLAPAEAWPQQLAMLGGLATYNLAYGGYGPTHRLFLIDDALSLQPKVVVEAFYSGNDLFDCFDMVYGRQRLPGLKSADPAVLRSIEDAETQAPLLPAVNDLSSANPGISGPREFLSLRSKLYGLARAVKRFTVGLFLDDWQREQRHAASSDGAEVALESEGFKTVLTPRYRFRALNLDDPRIAEGHGLALEAIRRMWVRTLAAGTGYVVVLIPTKELVFETRVDKTRIGDEYSTLVAHERRMWDRTRAYLADHGIAYLDGLPALQACLAEGRQPFHVTRDGHLNEVGQEAIARLVLEFVSPSRDGSPERG